MAAKGSNYDLSLTLPKAIYLDTNMLLSLPVWSPNIEFAELRRLASIIGIGLYIPQIVVRELKQRREEGAKDAIKQLKVEAQSLSSLLRKEVSAPAITLDYAAARINSLVTDFIRDLNLQVVDTPQDISMDTLVEMAVRGEAPFSPRGAEGKDKGDKGFKDALILFTVMQHMIGQGYKDGVFLTKDGHFDAPSVKTRLTQNNLTLSVFRTFTEAKDFLNSYLKSSEKSKQEREDKEIRRFLNEKFDFIDSFIMKNAKISADLFKNRFPLFHGEPDPLAYYTVKRILGVRPKTITHVFRGHISGNAEEKENAIAVSFSVSIQFDLMVQENNWLMPLPAAEFPLADKEAYEELSLAPLQRFFNEPEERQVSIDRSISAEGYILVQQDRLHDLVITNILSP